MTNPEQDEAVDWAVRTSDPDFDDWDAFDAWLDGGSARADAYRHAMIVVAEAAELMAATAQPVADVVPLRRPPEPAARPRRWVLAAGFAMAASVAGVLVLAPRPHEASPLRVIDAPAGTVRRIALADGSAIELAGGGRLTLDPARPRGATVDRGRAMFTVRHDEAAPFRVTAGAREIVDVGTAFEVVRDGAVTDVAVAEGAVVVDPAGAALRLRPGQRATWRDGGAPEVTAIAPDTIAQWRRDRMTYRDAPLAEVAADLSAALGRPVALGPGLAARRFSGSLVVAQVRAQPGELAALLDVRVRDDGQGWTLLHP